MTSYDRTIKGAADYIDNLYFKFNRFELKVQFYYICSSKVQLLANPASKIIEKSLNLTKKMFNIIENC
ncbi:hypothetical protein BpHYR1_019271 [Brachionus plicatilis]|uniref:Uncharacterized protein n=1 Tax=Brachionus plicatilis TaxID=10195 RepID=A0A3M7PEI6_BRAPC|nr:hypothetical protein BpHYR1_019271 [Brachionus plicatilis]